MLLHCSLYLYITSYVKINRVTPARRGVQPNYGQFDGSLVDRENKLQHLVSSIDDVESTPIKVHQDVNLFAAEFTDLDHSLQITIKPNRMAYLLCMEGSTKFDSEGQEVVAVRHDAVELYGPLTVNVSPLELEATEEGGKSAHFMFFEMQQDSKGGRSDV